MLETEPAVESLGRGEAESTHKAVSTEPEGSEHLASYPADTIFPSPPSPGKRLEERSPHLTGFVTQPFSHWFGFWGVPSSTSLPLPSTLFLQPLTLLSQQYRQMSSGLHLPKFCFLKCFSPLWEASYLGDNLTLNNSLVSGTLYKKACFAFRRTTQAHMPPPISISCSAQFCGDERGLQHSWKVGTQAWGSS